MGDWARGYKWDHAGDEFRLAPGYPVINVTWEIAGTGYYFLCGENVRIRQLV